MVFLEYRPRVALMYVLDLLSYNSSIIIEATALLLHWVKYIAAG